MTHNDSSDRYNLNNTTPDLLKFQLQEQYRSTMSELHKDALDTTKHHLDDNDNDNTTTTNMNFSNGQTLQDSFSNHLQSQLDSDAIHLSTSTGIYLFIQLQRPPMLKMKRTRIKTNFLVKMTMQTI